VRLTDHYDMAGAPDGGGDNNQDISVQLVDQYNAAGESDEVITDNVATDEIVPAPNNELQVGTTMFTPYQQYFILCRDSKRYSFY
jgi:hypothetical protein